MGCGHGKDERNYSTLVGTQITWETCFDFKCLTLPCFANSQFSSQYVIYLFQFCLFAGYIFVPFRTLHIYISFKIIKKLFIHLLGNKINLSHPLLDFDLTFSKSKIFKWVIKSNKAIIGIFQGIEYSKCNFNNEIL